MERRITVKGIGHITAKPDYVVIHMTIDATNKKYEKAVEEASDKINRLSDALVKTGVEKDALQTVDFRVEADTAYKKTIKGANEFITTGFTCTNRMKLAFDFDSEKLSTAIEAITTCISHPKLNIAFTVKDEEAVKDALLKSAGANARRRAEILCDAAGGKLGNLVTVNYNWKEVSILSPMQMHSDYFSETAQLPRNVTASVPGSFRPDDIKLSDDAVFVWEII